MNNSQSTIALVRDAFLESLPDGSKQIYWNDASQSGFCHGAAGLRLIATLLQATPETHALIVANWGVDGKSWTDFADNLDGQSDTPPDLSVSATTFAHQYAGLPEEMAPFVRIGILVWRDDAAQGRIRLSADVEALADLAATTEVVADNAVTTVITQTKVGKTVVTNAYDRGSVYARTSGTFSFTTQTLTVETAMTDSTTDADWRTVATLTPFTATDQRRYVAIEGLDRYTRVVSVGTGAGTTTLDIDLFLRPEA